MPVWQVKKMFDVLNNCVVTQCRLDWGNYKGIMSIMRRQLVKTLCGNILFKEQPPIFDKVLEEMIQLRNTQTYGSPKAEFLIMN